MEKIKYFIDCGVPTYACNFKCKYCYISTWENWKQNEKSLKIKYSKEQFKDAFSKKRWGGCIMFNFCAAGETLLCKELLPIVETLLKEGHYCMIVTNGTISKRFDEICNWGEEVKKRLFIKFSYHYLELKKQNLLGEFFGNINKMKENKVSYTVEITSDDNYIEYIDEIKSSCIKETGALPHVTVCREENNEVPIMTKLNKEDYIKTWEVFDSKLFEFKMNIFGKKVKKFCYAGEWNYFFDMATGELKQCYRGKKVQNVFENTKDKIKKIPIGYECPDPHCWNGHAFLCFGSVPDYNCPTYAEMRNRVCVDGSEWLQPEMKFFMERKLNESNRMYNRIERFILKFKFLCKKYLKKIKSVLSRTYIRK